MYAFWWQYSCVIEGQCFVLSHYVTLCPRPWGKHEYRCKCCTICIAAECGVEMATFSTSVVLEYCLVNATTVKVQRSQFLHVQGGNSLVCWKLTCLTGGIRRLEGNLCHWRCSSLEVSEVKTVLLIRKYNTLVNSVAISDVQIVRACIMSIPQ